MRTENHTGDFLKIIILFLAVLVPVTYLVKLDFRDDNKVGKIIKVEKSRITVLEVTVRAVNSENLFQDTGESCSLSSEVMKKEGGNFIILGYVNNPNYYLLNWTGKSTDVKNGCTALSSFRLEEKDFKLFQRTFNYQMTPEQTLYGT